MTTTDPYGQFTVTGRATGGFTVGRPARTPFTVRRGRTPATPTAIVGAGIVGYSNVGGDITTAIVGTARVGSSTITA